MLNIIEPTLIKLSGYEGKRLEQAKGVLTYVDTSVDYEIKKHRNSSWFLNKYGQAEWKKKLDQLRAVREKCLLYPDQTIPSGLGHLLASQFQDQIVNKVVYPSPESMPWHNIPKFKNRYFQDEAAEQLIAVNHGAVEIGCHRRGDGILMYDGSIKGAEKVEVGDRLMGPDSKPRTVLELRNGFDKMFCVKTVNGQTMYVNGHHLLALRRTNRGTTTPKKQKKRSDYRGTNPIDFVTVEHYLNKSKKYKHLYKTFSPGPIVFPDPKPVPLDPYFLGAWLGDGDSAAPALTTMDKEIVDVIYDTAAKFNCKVSIAGIKKTAPHYRISRNVGTQQENPVWEIIRHLGLGSVTCSTKYIPFIYLTGSIETRMQFLAGLIDTDGSAAEGCYDFISKSKQLSTDVVYLARSLGFRASMALCTKKSQRGTEGEYHRVTLSGNLSQLPVRLPRKKLQPRKQKKDCTSFGFSVTQVSEYEEYFGFILDSDHLYLTDSFLVTHNTGLGKSAIIRNLAKHYGLRTVVMTPSVSIAQQMHKDFQYHFGRKNVGAYFDGTKEYKKLFVIAVAASLARVAADSEAYKYLSQAKVFLADESHLCPAKTLAIVCFGLLRSAPYRFFFSGTQIRGDGADMLLEGITNKIVYTMTVRQGVDQGYLSRPIFHMVQTNSDSSATGDSNELTRQHLYYNNRVNRIAADIANKSVSLLGHPTLILVEEVEQIKHLMPYLNHATKFAHGGLTAENRKNVPVIYHKSDPKELIAEFNAGKLPILVGTSCIAIGTDIQAVRCMIYLRGGKSEVEVKQSVGRVTRLFEGKTECNVFDFNVTNIPKLKKHALARVDIYNDIYGPVESVQWN